MLIVSNSREWKLKRQQREGLVTIINTTWSRIRQIRLRYDNYTCRVCGKSNVKLAVHHIKPREEGGEDVMDNLVTVSHGSCHKKIEPIKSKVMLFVTIATYRRLRNLCGYGINDELTIIKLCEELEKRDQGYRMATDYQKRLKQKMEHQLLDSFKRQHYQQIVHHQTNFGIASSPYSSTTAFVLLMRKINKTRV